MDIAYYTHPALLEPALSLVKALSRKARIHLFLEISAGAWRSAMFDLDPRELPPGIVRADPILAPGFPAGVRAFWQQAASFHLVVHPARRSIRLSSGRISRAALRFVAARAELWHVDDVAVSPRLALALTLRRHMPLVINVHGPQPHSGERNWRKALARRLAFP